MSNNDADNRSENTPSTDLPPSKSQLKREAQAITDLGAQLVALTDAQLAAITLPDNIREAVLEVRGINAHGGRKRALMFLGKQLRREDITAIEDSLQAPKEKALQLTAQQHRIEGWRDRLLADPTALTELKNAAPALDVQLTRQLLRSAAMEARKNKPPAAARKLFRLLRELDDAAQLPDAQA